MGAHADAFARCGGCRDRDIAFTVVIFPLFYRLDDYPFEDIHRRLGKFAAGEGIEWIDLLPPYAGRDERATGSIPVHPNTLAHREAAEFLYNAVDW